MKRIRTLIGRSQVARLAVIMAVLGMGMIPARAHACPNCKEAVGDQGDTGLADGFNYTVLGLVSLPFLLVGTVATVTIRSYTRRRDGVVADTRVWNGAPETDGGIFLPAGHRQS